MSALPVVKNRNPMKGICDLLILCIGTYSRQSDLSCAFFGEQNFLPGKRPDKILFGKSVAFCRPERIFNDRL